MLERLPAAAESTAHFFLRSAEQPVRSSRVLDPRFWRNGADQFETPTWWSSYLQRVRTVPQIQQSVFDDASASLCPSKQRRATPNILRPMSDSYMHVPVTIQAQQPGTTFRSYSVSVNHRQSAGPRVAEDHIENDNSEQTVVSERSYDFPKDVNKPRMHEVEGRVSEKKRPKQNPSLSTTSVPSRRTRRKAYVMQHETNVFDLAINASSDWLGDDFVDQQSIQPHIQSIDRKAPIRKTSPAEWGKEKHPGRGLSRDIEYRTFDLELLQEDSMYSHQNVFDLDVDTQQELDNRKEVPALTAETEEVSSGSDIHVEVSSTPESSSESDISTGWYNSNSFAALVPEEDAKPDKRVSNSPLEELETATWGEKTSPQPFEQKIGPSLSMAEVEKSAEESERMLQSLHRTVQMFAQDGKKMAKSLEARPITALRADALTQNHEQEQEQEQALSSSELGAVVSQRKSKDPKQARFETLLRVRTSAATTTELLNEAWSLFLSFDNQETLAPYMFRLLNQSADEKNFARALAAFNTIPRNRRTKAMYKAAMEIELRRHQHGSATNLAFEANIRGFSLLPDLLAYLVKNLLWNSIAEVLHRNLSARQEFAQFAAVPDLSASASRRMLSIPDLTSSCKSIPELQTKALSLAERVQSSKSAFIEHAGLLRLLLQQLAIQIAESKDCLSNITPQALVSILDLEDLLGYLALHNKALSTIFRLPSSHNSLELALVVYRNFRFKHPDKTPKPGIINKLISLCGNADQSSIELFDYLLQQFLDKPDSLAYHKVITFCAREGNAAAVKKYLKALIRDHGRPSRAALVNPMIYAYAVVGDTFNAREQLNQLATKYNLEPDTVSWNMLLLAHVRSDNDVSAFDVKEEMRTKSIAFNHYTYGQLLAVCASHGDIESALDVLVDARDDGIEITIPMIQTVVETYLRNDNSQAALRFAMTAIESEDEAALTRLWNSFIRYFAFKGNLKDLMRTRDIMARYDIKPDGMTYTPIMTLLTSLQRTSEAMELLRRMYTEEKLPATMLHYTIILHGFVAEGNRDMAAIVFSEMKQRFPAISASAHAAMLYLQARRDMPDRPHGSKLNSSHGLKMLAELLKDISSVKGSLFNSISPKPQTNDVAVSMYFETILRALIRSGFHESATQLMKHMHTTGLANPKLESDKLLPSKGMTLAQLDIAMERQDWAEFERIFQHVFQSSVKRNSSISEARDKSTPEDERPSRIAIAPPHAKYSLSSYFNRYMEAMARQFRQRTMVKFFRTNLSRSGYVFTGRNWNKYIQVLCRSRQSEHHVRAFRIFERTMMRKTQSWKLLARGKLKKTTTKYAWEPYGQRNRPVLQKRKIYRLVKRSDELRFHPERRVPTYLTTVHLGAVLLQAHFRARRGLLLQFDLIRRFAPRAKRFIQLMPRLKDGVQGSILRHLNNRGDVKPRPRSERSIRENTDLTGILGDPTPLNHIPAEFFEDIEEVIGRGNLVRSLLKNSQTNKAQVEQGQSDVELGELLTGQISRMPIVLSGKGRLETLTEMKKRVGEEEAQKRTIVERLREDLRARQLAGDNHRSSPQVGLPLELLEQPDTDAIPQQPIAMTSPAFTISQEVAKLISQQIVIGHNFNESHGGVTVQQELDKFAEKRQQRNDENEANRLQTKGTPQLAIPYMDLRRLRRRLALRQHRQAWQLLAEMKENSSPRAFAVRVAATARREAYTRARRRRQAVLAYERDLKAGKRLDPFPQTEPGFMKRKFKFGGIRVRFVPILGRKSKNYLVRRGRLHDRRQRRVQTVPSKGVNYVTRYTRMARWMEARYGPIPEARDSESTSEGGETKEDGVDEGDEVVEDVYKPFSA